MPAHAAPVGELGQDLADAGAAGLLHVDVGEAVGDEHYSTSYPNRSKYPRLASYTILRSGVVSQVA